jgi:ElaB/YqjD/DUF883 family membrane-anchored ribosome-binding protein
MESHTQTSRPPISDNPWFWAYVFATAGLVGVMLLGSKLDRRQEQLDGNFTRRQELLEQRAAKNQGTSAEAISVEDSAAPELEERYVTFPPLYIAIAIGAAIGWIMLWRQHFYSPLTVEESAVPNEPPSQETAL